MNEHTATGCAAWALLILYTLVTLGLGFLLGWWLT